MIKPFNLEIAEALWVLGMLPTEDLPDLAADAIAQGIKSVALVKLAECSSQESQEIEQLFDNFLTQKGGSMAKMHALKLCAKVVSQQILESKVTAQDGAKEIWRATLKARIDGFHELDAFIYAASEMEDRPQDRNLFEKAIMEEARRWSNLTM
jgi:hypothetical protein